MTALLPVVLNSTVYLVSSCIASFLKASLQISCRGEGRVRDEMTDEENNDREGQ